MRNMRRSRGGRKKRGGKKNQRSEQGLIRIRQSPLMPPIVKQKPIQSRVIRYVTNSLAANSGYGPRQLINTILWCTNGSSTAYPIIEAVRLRRISMYYAPSNFDSSPDNFAFRWVNQNLPDNLLSKTGTPFSPAVLKLVPPLNSLAAMWYDQANVSFTTPLPFCELTGATGTIIDIDFDYIIGEGTSTSLTLSANATFTGLGYLEPISMTLLPVGLTNLVWSNNA